MNKTGKNAVSNIIAKLWTMIATYLFVPFYINILGEESYGIVSFFATLQMAINILGLGLANTLRREFAVNTGDKEKDNYRKKKLLNCIELIYIIISILVSVICIVCSTPIANNWLNIGKLEFRYVANAVALMGISIAIQMVASLYSGCLFGLDLQVQANVFQIIWSIAKYCGSLMVIEVVADLRLFYLWHIITDLIYLFILRIYLAHKISIKERYTWSFHDFIYVKGILKYTIGILIISIVALVNKELDKIIISGMLSLTELGGYNLATTLGNISTVFASAMYVSVFSGFTSDISMGNKHVAEYRFLRVNKLVNITTSCMMCFLASFSIPLLEFWTRSTIYSDMLSIAAPFVVFAIGMIEFQEIPYAYALANGNTKINVLIGIIYLPIVCVFTWIGIKNWGLLGAGLVYFLVMSTQTVIYEYLVYKKYLRYGPIKLIFKDTIIPIAFSLVLAFFSKRLIYTISGSTIIIVMLAVLFGGLSLVIELLVLDMDLFKILIKKRRKS